MLQHAKTDEILDGALSYKSAVCTDVLPTLVASQSAASPGREGERGLSVALLSPHTIMRRNKELGIKQQKNYSRN